MLRLTLSRIPKCWGQSTLRLTLSHNKLIKILNIPAILQRKSVGFLVIFLCFRR
jgi:hypothetical protein